MAARPIGSATISFGLVSIPTKLYPSTESSRRVSFNMIHKDCGSRIKQQYYCPKEDRVIERDEIVKGYEFAKDQYVLFEAEELKALEAEATQTIEISEFVPSEQVGRVYHDRTYFLGPDKGGDRAYRLLARAMEETGWAALAKYAARGKMYLVLIRPVEGRLVMDQLYYPDEIRDLAEVPVGEGEVKDAELQLATQLIQQISSEEFHPETYRDEVTERIVAAIEEKVEGREITMPPAEEPTTQVIDLMEALKASISKKEEGGEPAARKPAKKASTRKKASKKAASK